MMEDGEMTYHADGAQGKEGHENLEDLHLDDVMMLLDEVYPGKDTGSDCLIKLDAGFSIDEDLGMVDEEEGMFVVKEKTCLGM